ncbi:MAG: DoxX family protein [Gammaproteobacteria bacterium]
MTILVVVRDCLEKVGTWLPQLALRLLLAWEYGEAGVTKLRGENWFGHVQDKFLFPFNYVPPAISWTLATWTEIIGALLLVIGLGTRFVSVAFIGLTVVAIGAVHWPDQWSTIGDLLSGYTISDQGHGNFKLPVIFIVMLLPLLFWGAGKASVDHWIRTRD